MFTNPPLFVTQFSLTFDFDIASYKLPFPFLLFYILIYGYIRGLGHAQGCKPPTHRPLTTETAGSSSTAIA